MDDNIMQSEDLVGELRDDELLHYGMPRRSGRYPWGSGDHPFQHCGDFLSRCDELKSQGLSEKEIAEQLGCTTTQLRVWKSAAKSERRSAQVAEAKGLKEKGYTFQQIAEQMGLKSVSSVQQLLDEGINARRTVAKNTADYLKKVVDEHGMVDVGKGVETQLGVSTEKLREALYMLEGEGYEVYGGGVQQATNPGQQTNLMVLCKPGTEHKEIYNYNDIYYMNEDYSPDGGDTFEKKWVYPESMDSSRLKVRYAEDGGLDKDGLIEIRRGVDDLSLGEAQYAQVRILVDGTHYIKGMAVYSDDLPDGVDVIFNTNKSEGTPVISSDGNCVLKKIKDDPDNPFGSLIKEGIADPDNPLSKGGGQSYYYDKDGNKKLSLINKRAEEGDWGEWADTLPSQFLSKQNMQLIKKQLGLAKSDKDAEFEEIMSCTNPTVKKVLLDKFSEDCDAAAVHLKAAALPRQKYQVIIPVPELSDDEIYAPNYDDGEQVALVRYPHGGTFEIPVLTVNNKSSAGKKVLGTTPEDAVGINSKVAGQLSGADFDGDTVMVIPIKGNLISHKSGLKELEGFDPKVEYGGKAEGTFKKMRNTQTEMGKISNLITDMTLKGADDSELARAVKHSMVVIDAEKHNLDYKQSEEDNGIAALKREYQLRTDDDGTTHTSASTLISRAGATVQVTKRKGSARIDKETGEKSYKEVEEYYTTKNGKTKKRTQDSTQMAETKDARTLSSGTPQEEEYADYANYMKALGNKARKEKVSTGNIVYSPSARKTYAKEVEELDTSLTASLLNAPKERHAQTIARSVVNAKVKANPDITSKEKKKISQQALTAARAKVGAKRTTINITDKQWEAIQAGAITETKLYKIISHADADRVKELAIPRKTTSLSPAKISKAKSMAASGYTGREIAKALGVSTTTVHKYLNGEE